jgi:sec-independent protein translocase protein TatA
MLDPLPLQLGIPGGPELLVILLIAVLLFGANKIPKLARSTGEAMGEFQKGREEVEQELQDMREGPGSAESSSDAGGSGTPNTAVESERDDEDLGISEAETETADETTES